MNSQCKMLNQHYNSSLQCYIVVERYKDAIIYQNLRRKIHTYQNVMYTLVFHCTSHLILTYEVSLKKILVTLQWEKVLESFV